MSEKIESSGDENVQEQEERDVILVAISVAQELGIDTTPSAEIQQFAVASSPAIDIALDAYHELAQEKGWWHEYNRGGGVRGRASGLDEHDVPKHLPEIKAAMRKAIEVWRASSK